MESSNRSSSAAQLLLLLALAVAALVGCGGGGGGESGTAIQFTDEWGAFLQSNAGFQAQLTGGSLPAPVNITPNADGRATVDAPAGTYRLQATLRRPSEFVRLAADQQVTLPGTGSGPIIVKLADPDLSAGWAMYRAGDLSGALAEFTQYRQRAGTAEFGANAADDALGWTHAKMGDFNDSVQAFTNILQASARRNTDALVGGAGILLVRNAGRRDWETAETLLTDAINTSGEYSSAPTHDDVQETDLFISRALAHYLQGDRAAAMADLNQVRSRVATSANFAGIDLFNSLDLLLRN
ncbi:MAG TPA: hypothetical protein VEI97_09785 [bacterium]|nr:hypothetical protein [bacterium]